LRLQDLCTVVPSATPGARQTVLVLPGGGYREHADYEAEPVAQWLSGLGVHAIVLRYPVAPQRYPQALGVARAAMRAIRGDELGPETTAQAGVLGFSAGGHPLRYAEALHRARVPVELHVYPTGPHGLGLADGHPAARWTDACAEWMRALP